MFYNTANQIITQVQNATKTAVETVVFDKSVREATNNIIDAQGTLAKLGAKFVEDSATLITRESKKAYDQVNKFDFAQFDYTKFFKQPSMAKSAE